MLHVSATDDVTTSGTIGYRFSVVSGRAPEIYEDLAQALVVDPYSPNSDEIGLRFNVNAAPFSFDLEVVAIDGSGNESAPVVITIDG